MTKPPEVSLPPGATIAQARRVLAAAFKAAHIESADTDARLLVGDAPGLDHAGLTVDADRIIGAQDAATIENFAERRLAHEPFGHRRGIDPS